MRPLLSALLMVVGAGCAAAAPGPSLHSHPAVGEHWQQADDEVSRAMQLVADKLAPLKLKPSDTVLRGFVAAGSRHSYPLWLPPQTCASLVAIASRGIADIDAALYDPDGELLAADAQPDSHPTIQVCAGDETRHVYYALHAYEGAGTFLMVAFQGTREGMERALRLLGGQPAVAQVGPSEPDVLGRVSSFAQGVRRRGFSAHSEPLRVRLEEGQRIRVGLRVRRGNCYTAAGFALGELHDVNLLVLDDEGEAISADEAPINDAATQFCPRRSGAHAIEVHAAAGSGVALLTIFRANSLSLGGERGLWLGRRPQHSSRARPLQPSVDRELEAAKREGFRTPQLNETGELRRGQVVEHQLNLPVTGCTRLLLLGGPGLHEISLSAVDPSGTPVARSPGKDGAAHLHLCDTGGAMRARVQAVRGQGAYALVALTRAARVDERSLPPHVVAAHEQVSQLAKRSGFAASKGTPRALEMPASRAPLSIPLDVPAGRCVRAYVYAEGPGATAHLEDQQESLEPADPLAPLHSCSVAGRRQVSELRLTAAPSSRLWLWLFERPAAPPPSAQFTPRR